MVVCHFFTVDDRMQISLLCSFEATDLFSLFDESREVPFHIIRQESAIGTRVRYQFLFIQRLGIIQRLLCRIAKFLICFTLQSGQIKKRRSLLLLFLFLRLSDLHFSCQHAFCKQCLGFLSVRKTLTTEISNLSS